MAVHRRFSIKFNKNIKCAKINNYRCIKNHEIVSRNFNEVSNTEGGRIKIQVFGRNEENTGYDNKFLKTHLAKTGVEKGKLSDRAKEKDREKERGNGGTEKGERTEKEKKMKFAR